MELLTLFFISSGIFLGWSLGANHAVNVFGTAVISKMVKFRLAALVAGIFVILGSVFGGAGATKTLNELGGINAIAGSFTVALAVGISVTWMTKLKLPVSTSQAVVGSIIGWNLFTGSPTDFGSLSKIIITWILSPIIAGGFGFGFYKLVEKFLRKAKIHLLELDTYVRSGLLIVGAMASYALGANNIANVMGLFVSSTPLSDLSYAGFSLSGTEQLFLLGSIAIAIGIYTYGHRVMVTVGTDLYKITPISGLVVVLAESFVLFLFSSQDLESLLLYLGLPTIPLVPLSSTQAVIGAVIGVGIAKGGSGINYRVFAKISTGWVITPIISCLLAFVSLFFVQNVFEQKVINTVNYQINNSIYQKLKEDGIRVKNLKDLIDKKFSTTKQFKKELLSHDTYNDKEIIAIFDISKIDSFRVDTILLYKKENIDKFTPKEISCFRGLANKVYIHRYDFINSLYKECDKLKLENEKRLIQDKKEFILKIFKLNN